LSDFWLGADTETDSLEEGLGNRPVLWQYSDGVSVTATESQPYLGSPRLVFHNAKYDAEYWGVPLRDSERWDDTMLMAYVLRYPRLGLKVIGPELTGVCMDSIKSILEVQDRVERTLKNGTVKVSYKKRKRQFSDALREDREQAIAYAEKDAVVTAKLYRLLSDELDRTPPLREVYEFEKRVTPYLYEMEERGVLIDQDRLRAFGADLDRQLEALQADSWINLGSPDQVERELRCMGMGSQLGKVTESGSRYCVDEAVLRRIRVNAPSQVQEFIDHVLLYREKAKCKGTYVDGILSRIGSDGRLHGEFVQTVADTGRLSSRNPNLQNIPNPEKDPWALPIRQSMVAKPGYALVKADYSQLELRYYTDFTQDPFLMPRIEGGGDPHMDLCLAAYGERSKDGRKKAKNALYGKLYGASPFKTAEQLEIGLEEARHLHKILDQTIPTLPEYRRWVVQTLNQKGYMESLWGHRNYYDKYHQSDEYKDITEALRSAGNMPIQGTAAEIAKRAMLDQDGLAKEYGVDLLLQEHDEMVWEVPMEMVPGFLPKAVECMSVAGQPKVKITLAVDASYGSNWADQHKFGIGGFWIG
jgi:DNA polymerase I